MGVPLTDEEEFERFQEWVEERFNQRDTQSWVKIILFYSEDQNDALERFFDLFEDFLTRNKSLEVDETANLKAQVGK